jgi:hypothetical protein
MLASLLPGVRDLRVPLAAGYIWLLDAWLIWYQALPLSRPQGDGAVQALYDLGALLGRPTVIAAASFLAFLLGSILQQDAQGWLMRRVGRSTSQETFKKFQAWILRTTPSDPEKDRSQAFNGLVAGITGQFSAQLMVANERLYGNYDRLCAEAELRINAAPPIAALGVLLTPLDWRFIALVAVAALMAYQGFLRSRSGREVLIQAIMAGVIGTDAPLATEKR